MKAYLNKILKGQPLNYEAFLKALPADVVRNHRKLFATEKVAPNRWLVSVLDRVNMVTHAHKDGLANATV